MKVLVIGNGAREHALAWSLGAGNRANEVFCAPGNAGTAGVARNLPVDTGDPKALVATVKDLAIDLVVIGPEGLLAKGVADDLRAADVAVLGPGREAARLEASKAYARTFLEAQGIPCAKATVFEAGQVDAFRSFLAARAGLSLVLKKSSLGSGKGVIVSDDPGELATFGEAVLAADSLIAEEALRGRELSLPAICTEKDQVLLEPVTSHKRALAGDRGPLTGGMGGLSPLPDAPPGLLESITTTIVEPTFRGLREKGLAYRGVLTFCIIATDLGPRLLGYNVRFGDPDLAILLPRMEDDVGELLRAAARGEKLRRPRFSRKHACGVVVAAPGYPISHSRGLPVDLSGLDSSVQVGRPELDLEPASGEAGPKTLLFQSATGTDAEGGIRTGGGRCFTAVGLGADPGKARDRAYGAVGLVRFEGAWCRPDLGGRS